MQITKRRLKEIIKEEMEHLAESGDINHPRKTFPKATRRAWPQKNLVDTP